MSSKAVLKSSFAGYIYRAMRGLGIVLTIAGVYYLGFMLYFGMTGGKAVATISRLQTVCVLQGSGSMTELIVAEVECADAEAKRAQYPGVPLSIGEITYGNFAFTAEDGTAYDVRAPLRALEAQGAEHGSVIGIVYARENPENIRPAMPLGGILRALSFLSAGVAILFAVLTVRWIASHRRGVEWDVARLETAHSSHVRRSLRLPITAPQKPIAPVTARRR